LAGIIYIKQQVTGCQFYLNESVTHWTAPCLSPLITQADESICCTLASKKYTLFKKTGS